jgi:hypothetical protein
VERSERSGFRIRAIWAPEISNQGASGMLNEQKLGDMGIDLSYCSRIDEIVDWLDNSRDLIKMFTVFEIPQPVIGMGHSMGGTQTYRCNLR